MSGSWSTAAEALALVGAALVALAGLGVVRFADLYSRMHAATKASTLGIGSVASAVALAVPGAASRSLLAALAIFVTAPSAAHLIGRAAYRAEGIELELDGDDDLAGVIDAPDEGAAGSGDEESG